MPNVDVTHLLSQPNARHLFYRRCGDAMRMEHKPFDFWCIQGAGSWSWRVDGPSWLPEGLSGEAETFTLAASRMQLAFFRATLPPKWRSDVALSMYTGGLSAGLYLAALTGFYAMGDHGARAAVRQHLDEQTQLLDAQSAAELRTLSTSWIEEMIGG